MKLLETSDLKKQLRIKLARIGLYRPKPLNSQSSLNDEYLTMLYREFFDRAPDKEGIKHWKNEMSLGTSHAHILQQFLLSEEFKKNLPRMLERKPLELPMINSFSQFNEDQILIEYLINQYFENQYVVDVGAHSITGSNSIIFSHYLKWPTLLLEANSDLILNLQKSFPPHAKILNLAIGIENGFSEFYVSKNTYVSSLDKAQALSWGEQLETRTVPKRRLPEILQEHGVPFNFGLLTIDIEGLDAEVIHDLLSTSKYRPRFIIAEIKSLPEGTITSLTRLSHEILNEYEVIAESHGNTILTLRGNPIQ